jgi:hypothetical protein
MNFFIWRSWVMEDGRWIFLKVVKGNYLLVTDSLFN